MTLLLVIAAVLALHVALERAIERWAGDEGVP